MDAMINGNVKTLEPTREATDKWDKFILEKMQGTAFLAPCQSYYKVYRRDGSYKVGRRHEKIKPMPCAGCSNSRYLHDPGLSVLPRDQRRNDGGVSKHSLGRFCRGEE